MNQLNEELRCYRQSLAMIDKELRELKERQEYLQESRDVLQNKILEILEKLE